MAAIATVAAVGSGKLDAEDAGQAQTAVTAIAGL